MRFETRLGTPLSVRVLWPAHAMAQDARQRKPIASKLEPRCLLCRVAAAIGGVGLGQPALRKATESPAGHSAVHS